MAQDPVLQHWLVAVARAAGLDGASQLQIDSSAEMAAAWDVAALIAGVPHGTLAAHVARHYRLPVADLTDVDPHAYRLLPGSVARKRNVLPLRYSERRLVVATADPVSMSAEKEIAHIAGRSVDFEIAAPQSLAAAVAAAYPTDAALRYEIPPLTPVQAGGPLILVVDDDPDMRLMLRAVLEKSGHRVREAVDGPEALEALAGPEPFALMTLDLNMDKMSGLDVLKKVRSRLPTAHLPVVVATGSEDSSVEMQLFEAGADDFVVKPVDPPRFLLRIQAVLRRRSSNPLDGLF